MQGLPSFDDPDLLIGADLFSDAGVYRTGPDQAIVQSVDFFPPLVDDPFAFGQIAAANSMSDIYAMGGTPRTALNIVGFPDDKLDLSVLAAILRGGAERVLAAGAVILGGHSVRDAEIKYGMAVTGLVNPASMITNRAAKPGDVLVLTKQLGTGFITTAIRKDECDDAHVQSAIASMIALNDIASRGALRHGANAATDITGFGLAGHALEMAQASDVTIDIETASLPLLPGALELAASGYMSRANATNRSHVSPAMYLSSDVDPLRAEFLFDPQTSGGLLISLPAPAADALVSELHAAGVTAAVIIGSVRTRTDAFLRFH